MTRLSQPNIFRSVGQCCGKFVRMDSWFCWKATLNDRESRNNDLARTCGVKNGPHGASLHFCPPSYCQTRASLLLASQFSVAGVARLRDSCLRTPDACESNYGTNRRCCRFAHTTRTFRLSQLAQPAIGLHRTDLRFEFGIRAISVSYYKPVLSYLYGWNIIAPRAGCRRVVSRRRIADC